MKQDAVIAALIGLAMLLIVGVGLALSQEPLALPPDAQLLQEVPLPCGGSFAMHDADKDPANGAEYVTVNDAEGKVLAILEYGAGADGAFKQAVVYIPGQPPVYFMQAAALSDIYPHPCDIMLAAGTKT